MLRMSARAGTWTGDLQLDLLDHLGRHTSHAWLAVHPDTVRILTDALTEAAIILRDVLAGWLLHPDHDLVVDDVRWSTVHGMTELTLGRDDEAARWRVDSVSLGLMLQKI